MFIYALNDSRDGKIKMFLKLIQRLLRQIDEEQGGQDQNNLRIRR